MPVKSQQALTLSLDITEAYELLPPDPDRFDGFEAPVQM